MWVFVRLFGCLLIRVSMCFLGWLVVCVFVCLCVFRHLAAHFRALLGFWKLFCVFLALLGDLKLHCNTWGSTLPIFLDNFAYFRTWWDLGAQLVDSWAPFGRPWGPFECLFTALEPDPGSPFRFFG